MSLIEKTKQFVLPYYAKKNIMHDFSHIERMLKLANKISKRYKVDKELLILGAYFHGLIHIDEQKVIQFLKSENVEKNRILKIVEVAWASQKDNDSELIEGKILHDAHLLEGGKTYQVVKTLVTGTAKGQTLKETLEYLEKNVNGKFKCALPESRKAYSQKQKFTKEFLKDLKANI